MERLLPLLFLAISFLPSIDINAQDCDRENFELLGHHSNSEMYFHVNKKEFRLAIEACTQKMEYYFQAKSWPLYIRSLNDRAFLYDVINDLGAYKKAVFSNFEEAEKYLKSDHPQWLRAKEQINTYYYIIGDYKNSLEIVKEVVPIKEKLNISKLEIANTYLNLGTAYNKLKDSDNALSSFKKSIKVLYGDGRLGLNSGERLYNIARTFKSRGDLDSALAYLEKTESLFDTIDVKSKFKTKKVSTYILLVETWLEIKDYQKAKYYLDLVEKLPLNTKETIIWLERLAKYYSEIGQFTRAKGVIIKANDLAKESGVRYSPPLRARRNIDLSKNLVEDNNDDEALNILQQSLHILAPTFLSDDFRSSPKSELLFAKPDALIILQEKARILKRKYTEQKDSAFLKSSFQTYLTACDVIRDVRQGIRSTDSKNDLSKTTISVYEEAISTAYQLFKITGDTEYISIAFQWAESNKAQLLLENLNEQEARGFAGIPDSLSEKEKGLRLYLAALEDKALREGKDAESDDNIFNLRQEISQFSTQLEKSYPRYYKQKYNNDPVNPSFVQEKMLEENTALIEYFVGVDKIYVFVIAKDFLHFDELNKQSIDMAQISKFRNILKNRPGNKEPEIEYAEFVASSRSVYNSFVKNALENLPESINTLIVVPDDQINYIPFEVLLMNDPAGSPSYTLASQSYLFEDYAVNYNYSATLLNKVVSKESNDFKSNFIGYAPTFEGITSEESRSQINFELSNLKCSKDEVSKIKSIIGGEKRISEEATKANFLNEANNYKIIHLATHAFVNQNDSKLNRIFLQDDFLSDVNLYNLELNTELAVLSACNTGSGELLKGEGVMNLARGFINAGCSSTLMSMWSVDDCATSDLMLLFYKELKNDMKKDEALQRAKIEYLNTANKSKLHPYYWAAFIPFGDMKAMELSGNWYQHKALPIGLIALLFGFFAFYFSKKNK